MTRFLQRLSRNERGASVIEFALLAPVFIGLMIGVVEVGLYMQNYNAVRSLGTDAARFAAVEYQKNNKISETTLEENIRTLAIASPYQLNGSRLTVEVDEITPSPVNGARQFELNLTYELADIMAGLTIDNISLTYSRQIFVLA